MKRMTFAMLAMFLFQVSMSSQIGHDTCEDALLVPLDFCDYVDFDTDFSLTQDETNNPNVNPPICDPTGPVHDAWFKFATNGQTEFGINFFTSDAGGLIGLEFSDACNGNIIACDIIGIAGNQQEFFTIPTVDSLWVRMWPFNNSWQGSSGFCFSNLTILSVEDIVLQGEIIGSQNQLNWELDSGLGWKEMKLQVYNEKEAVFTTIKSFNESEANTRPLSFNYTDPNPEKASTYRLLIIDKDDTQHFSNTLFIENENVLLKLTINNPSFDRLHVFANDAGIEASYKIKVLDASGRQCLTTETSTLDGFSMDVSNLVSGIYYAWIINQLTGVPQVLKFIKL